MIRMFIILLIAPLFVLAAPVTQNPTKVGNGDDGADLENLQKITTGVLVTSKEKASQLLEKMNVRSVQYLGALPDDLQKSDMYLSMQTIETPKTFDAGLEKSDDGKNVYARTMPTPVAAVRFFPSALTLTEDQLVRLHIHESLHHTLPESIRENESAVSEITLAVCSPQSSRDQIEMTVKKYMDAVKPAVSASLPSTAATITLQAPVEPSYTEKIQEPSSVTYGYQSFNLSAEDHFLNPVTSLQTLQSYLHPWGGPNSAFGIGLAFSWISLANQSYMGPMEISARLRLATWRKFDIEVFGQHSAMTMSAEELKRLPSMRDTSTIGISIRREAEYFYTENYVSYTEGNDKGVTVGGVGYNQNYAPITDTHISVGGKLKGFFLGGTFDFLLTESPVLSGTSYSDSADRERVRVVKAGPEIGYNGKNFVTTIYYRALIDSTPGYNLSDMADLMGQGSGQGYAGATVSFKF